MKIICEGCNKNTDVVVNVVMPLPYGTFNSEMCVMCSLMIHEDTGMLVRILKSRAKKRRIKLPATKKGMQRLLKKR